MEATIHIPTENIMRQNNVVPRVGLILQDKKDNRNEVNAEAK